MPDPYLSEDHQQITSTPFVFVSYCWENDEIAKKVKDLVEFLRLDGIPVLFDEHGAEYGTNVEHLQYQITSDNCKYVFAVCDECFASRVKKHQESGVYKEFHYMLTEFEDNPAKFVKINAGGKVKLFNGDIYFDFSEPTLFSQISKFCRKKLDIQDDNEITLKQLVDNALNNANQLYDYGDYSSALSRLNSISDEYMECKDAKVSVKLRILHLKLNIYIKQNNGYKAVSTAKRMQKIIPSNMDCLTKARYNGNCALAYKLIKDYNYFEEYAKRAYETSKKLELDDRIYYTQLYAEAMFYTNQYDKNYKLLVSAKKMLVQKSECGIAYISNNYNMIESLVNSSKSKDDKAALKLLYSAEDLLLETSIKAREITDVNLRREMHRISSLVYLELQIR